jgi:hypothetical protein
MDLFPEHVVGADDTHFNMHIETLLEGLDQIAVGITRPRQYAQSFHGIGWNT